MKRYVHAAESESDKKYNSLSKSFDKCKSIKELNALADKAHQAYLTFKEARFETLEQSIRDEAHIGGT